MDAAQVEDAIHSALVSERSKVIGVIGDWGVGKTHLWKAYVLKHKNELFKSYAKYSYVSLFGLTSVAQIKTAIVDGLITVTKVTEDPAASIEVSAGEVAARRREIGTKLFKGIKDFAAGQFGSLGKAGGDALQMVIDAWEFRAVHRALVCLDDLERISDPLTTQQVMGVIDDLARQRGCKVVVIFSPENFQNGRQREALTIYREKTFDREVRLTPPFDYGVEIASAGQTEPVRAAMLDIANRLSLRNIRVLRRTIDSLVDVKAHVPEMNPAVERQLLGSLALLTYCHLVTRPGEPTIDEVLAIDYVGVGVDEGQNEKHTEFLRSYGWSHLEDFDKVLANYVKTATCDWATLSSHVAASNAENSNFARQQRIKAIWAEYQDRFMTPAQSAEFCERLKNVYVEEVEVVSTRDVDSAMWFLGEVGTAQQRDQVFDVWKAQHQNDRSHLDIERIEEFQKLSCDDLRTWCVERFALLPAAPAKDVREILMRISRDKAWGGDDTEFLASATPDDLARGLRPGLREVRSAVKLFLNPNDEDPRYAAIRTSMKEAIEILANESDINRLRMSAFGAATPGQQRAAAAG